MLFMSAAYIQVHCRLDFIMKANTMNPWEQSDLGPYCLQYRQHKKISTEYCLTTLMNADDWLVFLFLKLMYSAVPL